MPQPTVDEPAELYAVISPEEQSAASTAIEGALQAVKPGEATASGVEMVMPRRPRSAVAAAVHRTPPNSAGVALTLQKEPDQAAAPPAAAQAGGAAEADLIQTDIGPLPADLWQLLDQSPPARPLNQRASDPSQQPAPSPEVQTAKQGAVQLSVQAATLPEHPASEAFTTTAGYADGQPASNSIPLQSGGTAAPPAVVQTAPLPADGAEPVRPIPFDLAALEEAGEEQQTTGAAQNPPEDGEAGKETDVEELARQVYSQLRRRLLIEWERVRRR